MLRVKILASSLPLLLAAFVARGEWAATTPCIAIGDTSVQLATMPWQAQLTVAFTNDPAQATVRVAIVDTPESADFAIADDDAEAPDGGCVADAATRLIGIAARTSATEPVIYLTHGDHADLRIYVRSRTVTPRDAAALIVGARTSHPRIASAAL